MGDVQAFNPQRVETVPAGFEEKLIWLTKFGRPSVYRGDRGWNTGIKMNTNSAGASFEINSDFTHKTPGDAMNQLIERMLAALTTITGATHD